MTIGEVAELAGVAPATIRYYERRGLIGMAVRTPSGYRQYGPDIARRLRFIRRAQKLGFSLEEIHQLLGLRASEPASCARVAVAAEVKLRDIRRRLSELERIQATLRQLVKSCRARRSTPECPILDALTDRLDE